jgi:hypothetical protein
MRLEDRIHYLTEQHRKLSKRTDKLESELKNEFDSSKDQNLKELKKLKLSIKDELTDLKSANDNSMFASNSEKQIGRTN